MIKANELRIGNWVNNGEKNFTVDANVIYDAAFFKNYILYPIPLTLEILEKCGFRKNGEYYFIQPEFENIHFRLIEFPKGYWIASNGFINYNHELSNPKCLHQLQNLYFALYQEELTVQL